MPTIKLRHTAYEQLSFGANNEIQFGPKGGFDLGEVVIDTDHPLYDALWAAEGPFLEVVNTRKNTVYVSPIDEDLEFTSKAALTAHIKAEAKKGNAVAIAILAGKNEPEPEPELDDTDETINQVRARAKELGIKANGTREEILERIAEHAEG